MFSFMLTSFAKVWLKNDKLININELNKLEQDKDENLQYKNNLDQVVEFSETNNENSKNNFNKELLDNKSMKIIARKDQISNNKFINNNHDYKIKSYRFNN